MKRYYIIIFFLLSTFLSCYSQAFTDSNLPIVIINTDGNTGIPDSPRVLANMKIIFRGDGLRNYVADKDTAKYLNYDGRINIEVRGSSSQTLPKKQYGLSTLTSDNITERNVSLLGMPADNDWILNGLGFEPSLIRDYLCYNLSRLIGDYASRTVYCEVILNGSYNGLYVLEEKIKQGSERVNIAKMTSVDNSYPKVTGGYIVKADKPGNDPVAWTMLSNVAGDDVTFIYDYPKPEDISSAQGNYIKAEFEKLRVAAASGNADIENGFPSIIDIPSFVDYMIISELSSNADAYQYSTFFHKDKSGKVRAGPIWDNNLTFGNDLAIWNFDRSKTNLWQFSNGDNEGPKFWRDLFGNPVFRCCLYKRWNQLIQPGQPLNYTSIEALIDKTVATISEAEVRENNRWGTVQNWAAEISNIKDWLKLRIPWMTTQIQPLGNCTNEIVMPPLVITKIMYHPDSTLKFPDSDSQEFLEIMNTGSKTVSLDGVYFSGTGFVYQFPEYSEIFPGSAKIIANKSEVFLAKYGFAPSGQFTRNLSNRGEKLVLSDAFGNVIDSVSYSDHAPWPDADGNGYFLELIDPLSDNSLASNWRLSTNTILSVNNTESPGKLKFYPTPVKNMLTIESSGIIKNVELIDFQGRMLKRIIVNSRLYKLDMSSCHQGIYLIQIFTSDGNYVKKILKE